MTTLEGLTLQILFYYFCPLNNQQVYHCYIISCAQSVWKKDVWYRFSSKHTHTVRLLTGHPSWPLPPPIINVLFPPRSQMLQLSSPHTHTGIHTCQQEPPNIQIFHKQRTDRQTLQLINSMSLERLEGGNCKWCMTSDSHFNRQEMKILLPSLFSVGFKQSQCLLIENHLLIEEVTF